METKSTNHQKKERNKKAKDTKKRRRKRKVTREKEEKKTQKKEKKSRKSNLTFILLLMIGVGILSYPVISNGYYKWVQRQASAEYRQKMKNQKETVKIKQEMAEYNHELANQKGQDIIMPFTDEEKLSENKEHEHELGESLGVIEIPKITVELPIYHGTSEKKLLYGAGLLRGTSMPTGGKSTHAVITGHRGLPSAKLFTDLPKLEEKDLFYIHLANEILAYEVDQVKVVEPENMDDLMIVPEKDYVTLLTCTPYMINSHRLLVRGHRVPYDDQKRESLLKQANRHFWLEICFYCLGASFVIFWVIWRKRKQKMRRAKIEV